MIAVSLSQRNSKVGLTGTNPFELTGSFFKKLVNTPGLCLIVIKGCPYPPSLGRHSLLVDTNALVNLMHLPLSLETAQTALDGILGLAVDLSPELILAAVAQHYKLDEKELIGRSRRRAVSVPRQLCMYLIREETDASLPQIGEFLGGRDHTTVMHGCEKIGAQIETDQELRSAWLAIKGTLMEGTKP